MDNRVLYASAVVIASLSGGYYYYSGSAEKLKSESQNMTYSAKDIVLTQSDEQGLLYLKATVAAVQQNTSSKATALESIKAVMYQDGQAQTTFNAAKGEGQNDNSTIVLSGGVVAQKQSAQGSMQFKTERLIGYPKTNMIMTDAPVTISYPNADFVSQGLKANLNTSQYEFFNIRGKYAPNS